MTEKRMTWRIGVLFLFLGMLASLLLGNARFLNEAKDGAYLPDMVSGKAARPFVLRRLVPEMIGVLPKVAPALDAKVSSFVNTFAENGFAIQPAQTTMHAEVAIVRENRSLYFYLFLVNGFFLGIFGLFLFLCIREVLSMQASSAFWITIAALVCYPIFSPFTSHFPYDQATVAFVAMGLWGLVGGQKGWYWAALVVAPWNRETAVVLPVMAVILGWNEGHRGRLVAMAAAQIGYCLVVKQLIASWFTENRGSNMVYKLGENLFYLVDFKEPTLLPFYAIFGLLVWIHWRAWPGLPTRLKALILWVYPPVLLLHFYAGVLRETRAIIEIYPLIWMVAAPLIVGFMSRMDGLSAVDTDGPSEPLAST